MQITEEKNIKMANGWTRLFFHLLLTICAVIAIVLVPFPAKNGVVIAIPLVIVLLAGHFTLQPNEAMVILLFGKYKGTESRNGFFWGNPFYTKTRISKRARNFDGEKLKVNDKRGNPIEISAVVVWKVQNTAKAAFDVDDYAHFVRVQSESALRHLANDYAYDHGENSDELQSEYTLRSSTEQVSEALRIELSKRLEKAGVEVEEARLNHLAYAPEIASAMLRRQQADAIIAAREKIVDGAVSMVEMAIDGLESKNVVNLDEERKAAMVSNLLVILCSDSDAQPVVNTGSLYT
ncbi:MAG: SPFH domain-containing protein [Planctomycetia bacterium]|nr:SPFH domain-containing protein [Planctomycetia bacterium]MBL6914597.1 SPFH domain-containing protein [Planctomycetota bacterium]